MTLSLHSHTVFISPPHFSPSSASDPCSFRSKHVRYAAISDAQPDLSSRRCGTAVSAHWVRATPCTRQMLDQSPDWLASTHWSEVSSHQPWSPSIEKEERGPPAPERKRASSWFAHLLVLGHLLGTFCDTISKKHSWCEIEW